MAIMENWQTIALVIGLDIGGLLAIYGIFDKKQRERNKEADDLEDRMLKLYKTESEELNGKIKILTANLETLNIEHLKVLGENKTLKEIFQGTDKDTMDYRKQGYETFALAREMAKMVAINGKKADQSLKAIKDLYKLMQAHIKVESKAIAQK